LLAFSKIFPTRFVAIAFPQVGKEIGGKENGAATCMADALAGNDRNFCAPENPSELFGSVKIILDYATIMGLIRPVFWRPEGISVTVSLFVQQMNVLRASM
jgi:hypothetical protein